MIDKHLASALLAESLGADRLVILTQVDAVYRGFGTGEEEPVAELRPGGTTRSWKSSCREHAPKVAAAFRFVQATGGEALVTSADAYAEADRHADRAPEPGGLLHPAVLARPDAGVDDRLDTC